MSRTLRIADESTLLELIARTRGVSSSVGGRVQAKPLAPSLAPAAPQGPAARPALHLHTPETDEQAAKTPRRPQRAKPMRVSEDELQIACFEWIEVMRGRHPILGYVVHVPNGGKRPRGAAGRLKAMGVKKGVLDILLALPHNGWTGLAIELKVGTNKPTDEQREWLAVFDAAGYYTAVCYDFDAFQSHVMRFLDESAAGPGACAGRLLEYLEARRRM